MLIIVFSATISYALQETQGSTIQFNGKILFSQNNEIFLLDGSVDKRMMLAKGDQPKWSPDGKRIAYIYGNGLYIIDKNGKGQQKIYQHKEAGYIFDPRWKCSKEIYFSTFIEKEPVNKKDPVSRKVEEREILLNIETREIKKVEVIDYLKKTSKRIKGLYNYPSYNEQYRLVKLYYSDKSIATVLIENTTGILKELQPPLDYPGWSKNNKMIANYIASASDESFPVTFTDELIIYDAKSGKVVKRLKNLRDYFGEEGQVWCHRATWSPDTKYIAYECAPYSGGPGAWIYIVDLETGKQIKILEGKSPDWY